MMRLYRTLLNTEWREQKALGWASAGLIIFVSSFVWAPSRDGLETVYALAFFIPMLFVLPWRKISFSEYGGWFTVIALVYAGFATLSTLWAKEQDPGFFLLQFFILAIWLCGVSWVAHRGKLDIQKLLNITVMAGALFSFITLVVFYSKNSFLIRLEGWSVARNSNVIGEIFGAIALIAYCNWLTAKPGLDNLLRFVLFAVIGLSLIASQSRSALMAFALLVPYVCYVAKPGYGKLALHGLALVFMLVIVILKAEMIIPMFTDRGASGRDTIWLEIFSRSISEHPFFGIGMDKASRIIIPDVDIFNHAHNMWLDTFYRTGLIGLLLYLWHFFLLLRYSELSPKLFPLYIWLFFSCICCLFDSRGFFWQIDAKWFCYWVPAALISALVSVELKQRAVLEKKAGTA